MDLVAWAIRITILDADLNPVRHYRFYYEAKPKRISRIHFQASNIQINKQKLYQKIDKTDVKSF